MLAFMLGREKGFWPARAEKGFKLALGVGEAGPGDVACRAVINRVRVKARFLGLGELGHTHAIIAYGTMHAASGLATTML